MVLASDAFLIRSLCSGTFDVVFYKESFVLRPSGGRGALIHIPYASIKGVAVSMTTVQSGLGSGLWCRVSMLMLKMSKVRLDCLKNTMTCCSVHLKAISSYTSTGACISIFIFCGYRLDFTGQHLLHSKAGICSPLC